MTFLAFWGLYQEAAPENTRHILSIDYNSLLLPIIILNLERLVGSIYSVQAIDFYDHMRFTLIVRLVFSYFSITPLKSIIYTLYRLQIDLLG